MRYRARLSTGMKFESFDSMRSVHWYRQKLPFHHRLSLFIFIVYKFEHNKMYLKFNVTNVHEKFKPKCCIISRFPGIVLLQISSFLRNLKIIQ